MAPKLKIPYREDRNSFCVGTGDLNWYKAPLLWNQHETKSHHLILNECQQTSFFAIKGKAVAESRVYGTYFT